MSECDIQRHYEQMLARPLNLGCYAWTWFLNQLSHKLLAMPSGTPELLYICNQVPPRPSGHTPTPKVCHRVKCQSTDVSKSLVKQRNLERKGDPFSQGAMQKGQHKTHRQRGSMQTHAHTNTGAVCRHADMCIQTGTQVNMFVTTHEYIYTENMCKHTSTVTSTGM